MTASKNKTNCSVCGLEINKNSKFTAQYKGQTYYFCNNSDQKEFENRPQVYAGIERVSKTGRAA
jgi:YHS domain-containing protein